MDAILPKAPAVPELTTFATAALTGLLAGHANAGTTPEIDAIARRAWAIAEAMVNNMPLSIG